MEKILEATISDAPEILELQKSAYISEAELYGDYNIEPLLQTIEDVKKAFDSQLILKYIENGKIVGSVRGYERKGTCYIGKLMVNPSYQNQGIGKTLMQAIESRFSCHRFELFTGSKSTKNIALYEKLGYIGFMTKKLDREETIFIFMEKAVKVTNSSNITICN